MMSGSQDSEPDQGQAQGTQQPAGQPQGGQPPQGQPPGGQAAGGGGGNDEIMGYTQDEMKNFATFGVIIFGLVAVGAFIIRLLGGFIGDEEAIIISESEEELFIAARSAVSTVVSFSPLLAVGFAFYYYVDESVDGDTHPPALVATVAGVVLLSLVFLVLMVVFEPNGEFVQEVDFGNELPGLIALWIGAAITAGAAGFVFDNQDV